MVQPPAVSARARLASVLLAGLTTLLVVILMEGGLRAVRWTPEYLRVRIRLSNRGDLRQRRNAVVLDCYPSNPSGAFPVDLRRPEVQEHYRALGIREFAPALPESPYCLEFRFNSLGVRGPEYGPRRPGVKRVVVVGDSFTEGQGVREDEVYPSVLASRLEAVAPGRYEVLNFGQRATDFPELYGLFERALRLSPDLVIYGLCLNDAERGAQYDHRWPRLNDGIMVRRSRVQLGPWNSRLAAFVADRLDRRRIAHDTTEWYLGMYGEANRDGWERTREDLRRMAGAAQARGARLLVVIWPLLVDLEGGYPFGEVHQRLNRFCERQGIPHYDLLDALRGQRSASLWAHPADWHPNGRAHAMAAERLLPLVQELLPASPGP